MSRPRFAAPLVGLVFGLAFTQSARAQDAAPAPTAPPLGDARPSPPSDVERPRIAKLVLRADGPEEPVDAKGERWDAWAWARLRATSLSSFALDTSGTPNAQKKLVESRLRVGGVGRPLDWLDVALELDAVSGIAFGDTTPLGTRLDDQVLRYRQDEKLSLGVVDLRQAFVAVTLPFGQLRMGRMATSWGTGMVGNSGAGEADFGDRRFGDIAHRIAFGTRPLSQTSGAPELVRELTVFATVDAIWRDENADWSRGDRAYAGALGARTETRDGAAGVLGTYRTQRDRGDPFRPDHQDTYVHAGAVDGYGRLVVARIDDARTVQIEAEAAMIRGTTSRPYLDENRAGATIRSFGAVARAQYDDTSARLRVRAEVGYASGDDDPHDDVVRTFTFDPDYKVGLVLFEQVLPRLQLRSNDRLGDPGLLATPPSATRFLVSQGSVTNAMYVNPVVRFRPWAPLDLRLGYLGARSAGDLIDPYNSAKIGGYNATYGGKAPGSRALGHELDGSVKLTLPVPIVRLRIGVEGAVFFAGAALDGVGGGPFGTVTLVRGALDGWW